MPLEILFLLSIAGSAGDAISVQDRFCVWQTGAPCPPRTADQRPLKLNPEEFERAKAALETMNAPPDPVQSASTVVAVDIDADGKLTNCRVVESSGTAQLDSSVCPNVMKNARVGGAPGRDGKFKPTTRRLRISWREG